MAGHRPTTPGATRPPSRDARRNALLAATGSLYLAFGTVFGLMQSGLPPLLRARGLDLGQIGWMFLTLVPFGLTFLWAPLVDRLHPVLSRPRIGWIMLSQAVTVLALVGVAVLGPDRPALLLGLGLILAFATATMDVALDALAAVGFAASDRAVAGGTKMGALSIGSILGGGVFTALANDVPWTVLFGLVAALVALSSLPILLTVAQDRPGSPVRAGSRPTGLATLLRQRTARRRLAALTCLTCALVAAAAFNRVMLVEIGVPLGTVGWLVGTLGPVAGLAGAGVATLIMRRAGLGPALGYCVAASVAALAALVAGTFSVQPSLAIAGTIVVGAATSGVYVLLFAAVLGWVDPHQPATDYAAYYGLSRLAATATLLLTAQLIPHVGWPAFYAALAVLLPAAAAMFMRTMRPARRPVQGAEPARHARQTDRRR